MLFQNGGNIRAQPIKLTNRELCSEDVTATPPKSIMRRVS